MRTVLIAVLVLAASAAVANNHAYESARVAFRDSEVFSCGGKFMTLRYKSESFPKDGIIIIRRTAILEVWLWKDGSSADKDVDRKLVANVLIKDVHRDGIKHLRLSPMTTILFRKCLEDG